MSNPSGRLLSIDVLRGITIAGMILVNNPGSWNHIYAPLQHAQWNGLTPTDLVFPFFMFLMGVSTFLSLRKSDFASNRDNWTKIIKRTVIMFALGLALNWIGSTACIYRSLAGDGMSFFPRLWASMSDLSHLRILGVFQRLALSYAGASIIAITVKRKKIPYVIGFGLLGYAILLWLGNGYDQTGVNILARVDQAVLGVNHIYNEYGLDPEGILSTIPSIFHVLIGFCCGAIIVENKENEQRMLKLFIIGTVMMFAGLLLAYGLPMNKKIWSPTYVIVTCGMGMSLLALLIWIIDVKGWKRWSVFFESFGINPLFLYIFSQVLATFMDVIVLPSGKSLKWFIYSDLLAPWAGDMFGSLLFALLFVGVCWIVGNVLYKKKVYIKI